MQVYSVNVCVWLCVVFVYTQGVCVRCSCTLSVGVCMLYRHTHCTYMLCAHLVEMYVACVCAWHVGVLSDCVCVCSAGVCSQRVCRAGVHNECVYSVCVQCRCTVFVCAVQVMQ